ncbi:hypothetical protein ABK040_000588 [Willaertia magna]
MQPSNTNSPKRKINEKKLPLSLLEEPITPLSKKLKQEISLSSSSSSEKRKKGLCVNGRVEIDKYVYVEQEHMKKKIQTRIENGEFCILIAPSQSGKTSIVTNSLIPSLSKRGYFPVFIDMRGLIGTYLLGHKEVNFSETFLIYVNIFLQTKYESLGITSLFAHTSCIPEFKEQKVVLFLDEFDSIAELPIDDRKGFLAALSTMKQNKELYCLHSCLAITNWVGEYFGQTIGNSPFNVTNPIYGDYFSKEEVEQFFNEYENGSDKKISNEIRNNIFKLTTGAQGQTVMLTLYYELLCGEEELIDDKYWYSSLLSKTFWRNISSYQNFIRISSVLKEEMIARSLLNWFKDKEEPTEDIINILIKSNILKINGNSKLIFASPFIKKYILDRLVSSIKCEPLKILPISDDSTFDFLKLLPSIIKSMDRMSIVVESVTKQNHFTSKYPDGPKEILYQVAFEDAIKKLLKNFNIKIIPQKSSRIENQQSCDSVISIGQFTFLFKHCSNVSLSEERKDTNTLRHYIIQANNYCIGVKPIIEDEKRQTFILHWTTVPNIEPFKYTFPKCDDNISIIYIYHDELFSNVQIETKDLNTPVSIPIDLSPNFTTSQSQIISEQQNEIEQLKMTIKQKHMPSPSLKLATGSFIVNDMALNKTDVAKWTMEEMKTILITNPSKGGAGLPENKVEELLSNTINSTTFYLLAKHILREQGTPNERIAKTKEFLIKSEGVSNHEAYLITCWIFDNLIIAE